jgi:hypothetical protein
MPGGCSQASTGALIPAQRQRLVDGGHAQLGGPGGQRGTRRLHGPVAVAVGLDHGHHLRAAGLLAQQPHVVLDGAQVDQRLGEDARGQGYRRNGHGGHCPRNARVLSPSAQRALMAKKSRKTRRGCTLGAKSQCAKCWAS